MTKIKKTAIPMAVIQKPSWPKKKIGELFEVQLGKMLSQKAKQGELFPYLANFNVRWGSFDLSRLNKMAFSESEQEKFSLKPGDLLMCEGGEIGRCAIWRETGSKIFYQKALHRLRPLDGTINTEFIYYYMAQIASKGELPKLVGETSIAHLTREKLLGLHIPVPSIEEQTKIAKILSTWDKAIQTIEALIENSKKQKKALMQQLLAGRRRFPGFRKTWKRLPLSRVVEINYGKSPKVVLTENGEYPVIGTGGKTGHANCFLTDKHSVVVGRKGTIDKPILITEPFWPIDTTFYCTAKKGFNIGWLYFSICTINLKSLNESTGLPSLSRETLYSIKLNAPETEEQVKISSALFSAESEIKNLEKYRERLEKEKTSLMRQLMTGGRRASINEDDH